MREEERPSLIRVKSIIGWPSPNKQGTSKAHGSPLGEDEVRLTKEVLGWDPDQHFVVPDDVYEHFDQRRARRRAAGRVGAALPRLARRRTTSSPRSGTPRGPASRCPACARRCDGIDWEQGQARDALGRPEGDGRLRGLRARRWSAARPTSASRPRPSSPAATSAATRRAARRATSSSACASTAWAARSTAWPATAASCARTARRSCSSPTTCAARSASSRSWASRSRGSTRTTRSASARTARPTSRSSTSRRCARSRASSVIRPGDANETAAAWRDDPRGPRRAGGARSSRARTSRSCADADFDGVARGAYVLRGDDDPEVAIVGTGSELSVAIAAAELLDRRRGPRARRLDAVLGALRRPGRRLPRLGAAARAARRSPSRPASRMGWERLGRPRRWRSTASGPARPAPVVLEKLGITAENTAQAARELLGALTT